MFYVEDDEPTREAFSRFLELRTDHYIVKPIDTEGPAKKMERIASGILSRAGKSRGVNLASLENSGSVPEALL